MSFEKQIMGISFKGHKLSVGPLVGVLVAYKPDFFRNYSFLKLLPPDRLTILDLNKVVEMTQKNISDFRVVRIEPVSMKDTELITLEQKQTVELLNSQFKFWKHKINISIPYDISKEDYLDGIKSFLPHNLKEDKEVKFDKWIVGNELPKKPCVLADCYAQYLLNIALTDIKGVWGDFGSGLGDDSKTKEFIELNPTCPSIRGREYI